MGVDDTDKERPVEEKQGGTQGVSQSTPTEG